MNVKFIKVDVTRMARVASVYKVQSTPTLVMQQGKRAISKATGPITKADVIKLLDSGLVD